jgi:hypothetical protein
MRRYQILGLLLAVAGIIILLTWFTFVVFFSATSHPLIEQFTVAIGASIVRYGVAVFVILTISIAGTVVNRIRQNTERFFAFLYFLIFSILLVLIFFAVFYNEIVRLIYGQARASPSPMATTPDQTLAKPTCATLKHAMVLTI